MSSSVSLNSFDTIPLEQINASGLFQKRIDRKYVLPAYTLEDILHYCQPFYKVLEINGVREFDYKTDYYDTRELDTYQQHHNGRANRCKIRERVYLNTGLHYFEVKKRSHKGATEKIRMEGSGIQKAGELIKTQAGFEPSLLINTLTSQYTRITLMHRSKNEKVTIDHHLGFSNNGHDISFPNILMVEIKTPSRNESQLVSYMKMNGHREGSLSKYCFGLIGLNPGLKHNRFKKALIKILNKNTHGSPRLLHQ